ncbi:MAG: MFS transporter [Comamonas sp.]
MPADTQQTLRGAPMRPFQIVAIALCVFISMIDGFDVLTVAFTGPSIAAAWSLSPAQLGLVFSAGLAGMVLGSIFIAPLADSMGRRPIVQGCLLILTAGMAATAFARNLEQLLALRVFTGLGMGGILAGINTVVAEYASDRRRDLAISFMAIGYPIGAMLGGLASSWIIAQFGWHAVFLFGAAASAITLPLVALFMPESIDFLLTRRPRTALAQLNALRRKLGLPALAALPEADPNTRPPRASLAAVFRGGLARPTVLICLSYFLLMVSFYFLANWTPKVLVSMGLSVQQGISGAVLMNLGGIAGGLFLGLLAPRVGLTRLTTALLALCFVTVVGFGLSAAPLQGLLVLAAAIGFFMFGGMIGLYALAPAVFPPAVRATGTGLALGIGRLGATVGPTLAGLLIAAGWTRAEYFTALAVPLLLAAACVWRIRASAG